MSLDDNHQKQPDVAPTIEQPRQSQQGDFGNDAIDKGIGTENDGEPGTGNDVAGVDGPQLNANDSPEDSDLDRDHELAENAQAEDDPQANRDEQRSV